ncbi:hypothetical protein C8Q76DRAFT_802205 [Earliella scabrosa]|nr:hypothetical protein C8Q76DRAFT_802205 [Earliella scabrosa]
MPQALPADDAPSLVLACRLSASSAIRAARTLIPPRLSLLAAGLVNAAWDHTARTACQSGLNHPMMRTAVHAKSSWLWALGRCERPAALKQAHLEFDLTPDHVSRELTKDVLTFLLEQTKCKYMNLVFVYPVDPKGPLNDGPKDESVTISLRGESLGPRIVITTGGYNREYGITIAEETGHIIKHGHAFIANEFGQLDLHLLFRLRENVARFEPEPQQITFYLPMSERGYTMYPFSDQFLKSHSPPRAVELTIPPIFYRDKVIEPAVLDSSREYST